MTKLITLLFFIAGVSYAEEETPVEEKQITEAVVLCKISKFQIAVRILNMCLQSSYQDNQNIIKGNTCLDGHAKTLPKVFKTCEEEE